VKQCVISGRSRRDDRGHCARFADREGAEPVDDGREQCPSVSGGKAEYVPEAMIVHCHSLTLRHYLRQHFAYGRGLLRVRRRQRARHQRKRAPGPAFYARLVLHPLRRWYDLAAWRCTVLIGASQLATAVGAAAEFLRPTRRQATAQAAAARIES
jgi:hypothetical protein